jgi:hypothetical protein
MQDDAAFSNNKFTVNLHGACARATMKTRVQSHNHGGRNEGGVNRATS